jgi:hypothetical protein
MTEKSQQENAQESEATSGQPSSSTGASLLDAPVITMPKFAPHAGSGASASEATEQASTTPILQSYEDIQREASGPGVEEWRRVDRLRAELTSLYNNLRDDNRYAESYKSERAWARYAEVKEQIEQLAPTAREKMARSAEGLERLSIPTPEGEALVTKDTNKLLLSAHERTRLEALLTRAEKQGEQTGGTFKRNPHDILKDEYSRALAEGGPSGGATVRAIVGIARDWGLDLDSVIDEHRRESHHSALESAQRRLIQSEMVGRSVPQPPFPHPSLGGASGRGGDFHTGRGASAFVNSRGVPQPVRREPSGHVVITQPRRKRPSWK